MPYIGNIVQDFSVNNAMLNTDSVTSIKIDDGTIVNADINDSAAIAGTKISPDFGSQNIVTTGGLTVDTTTLHVDTSNNRIGIGTTSPATPLEVRTSSDTEIAAIRTGSIASKLGAFVSGESRLTSAGNNGFWTFYTGTSSAERMRVDATGKVGIGESASIDARLHVNSGTDNATLFIESTDGDVNLCMADNAGSCRLLQSAGDLHFRTGGNANAFGTGDSERMVINSSGNVGIGVTSPGEKLDVAGTIQLTNFLKATGDLLLCADIDNNNSGTALRFCVDGDQSAEKMRIQDSGNVGIGTTGPSSLLHARTASVALGSNGHIYIQSTDAGADIGGQLNFGNNNARRCAIAGRQESSDAIAGYLQFGTRGTSGDITERMRIDSSGNLGLGVTSISEARFRIKGANNTTSAFNDGLMVTSNNESVYKKYSWMGIETQGGMHFSEVTGGKGETMRIDTSGRVGIGTTSPTSKLDIHCGSDNTGLQITSTDAGAFASYFDNTGASTIGHSGTGLVLSCDPAGSVSSSNIVFQVDSNNERMRIDSSGRLLIGLTTSATTDSNGHQKLQAVTTAGPNFFLGRNDSDTADNSRLGVINFGANHGGTYHEIVTIRAAADAQHASNSKASRLELYTTNAGATQATERMRIDKDGNVGIGTTSPGHRLHLKGTDTAYGGSVAVGPILELEDSVGRKSQFIAPGAVGEAGAGTPTSHDFTLFTNNTERIRIKNTGNVGIGTSSPATQLEVKDSTDSRITITAGNAISQAGINFADNGGVDGIVTFDHNTRKLHLGAGTSSFTDGDITIDSAGNVGIGTNSPSVKLSVTSENASGGDIVSFQNNVVNHYGGLVLKGGQNDRECRFNAAFGNGFMSFYPMPSVGAGTEHMRIRQGGVCMGRTTLTSFVAALHVSATAGGGIAIATHADTTCMYFNRTDNNAAYVAMRFYVQGSQKGFIQVNTGSVTYSTSSDYRLKENVVSISDGITRLKKLKPYRFNFKEDTSKTLDGFFAHEASEAVPEAVVGEKDAIKDGKIDPQGIDQSKLVPLLTAALQEAITKIETLETKVAALEAA